MKAARIRSRWVKQGVPVPPILIFSITNRCNLECQGCYQQEFHPSTEQELSTDKLKEITQEAHQLGIYFFVIAGGFVHINAEGDVEPCPFAPISDTSLKEVSLKEALQSEFLAQIRQISELSKYTGGGCALWKNRERVRSLFQQR